MKRFDKSIILYSLLLLTFLLNLSIVVVPSSFFFLESKNYFLISAGVLVFIVLLNQILEKNINSIEINGIDIAVILFYIWIIFNSLVLNTDQATLFVNYILETLLVCIYFVFKYFFIGIGNHGKKRTYLVLLFLIFTGVILVIGYLEYFHIIPVYTSGYRITGGFINPGSYANCIAILFSIISGIFILSPEYSNKKIRILFFPLLGLCIIMLILCKSRTAWIASLSSFGFVVFHHKIFRNALQILLKTTWKKWLILGGFLVIISVGSYFLYQMKKDSANGRLFIWQTCLHMIHDKPIFGHGYNSFCKVFNDYQIEYFKKHPNDIANGNLADDGMVAFNDYLEVMVETGLIGLIIFLFLLFFALKTGSQSRESDYLITAHKAALIAIMVASLFSYPVGEVQNQLLFYFVIAFLSGAGSHKTLFRFGLRKYFAKAGIMLLLCIIILMEVYAVRQYIYHWQWMRAYDYVENNDYNTAFVYYDKLYPKLKNDWFFMFNYGSMLPTVERYDESVKILESCRNVRTSLNYYINLGVSYEAVKDYKKAEECYKTASFLIPHRFIPRYRLFKLYCSTGQSRQALRIAKEINKQQIKIYTPVTGSIKNEIIQYLNDTGTGDVH